MHPAPRRLKIIFNSRVKFETEIASNMFNVGCSLKALISIRHHTCRALLSVTGIHHN